MPAKSAAERFQSHVEVDGDHWLWTGKPQFRTGGEGSKVTQPWRFAWGLYRGDVPKGKHVTRTCGNPRCAQPWHLKVVAKAGPFNRRRGEQVGTAKLTAAAVVAMRRLRKRGVTFAAIGEAFGVSHVHAYLVVSGQRWKHVGDR